MLEETSRSWVWEMEEEKSGENSPFRSALHTFHGLCQVRVHFQQLSSQLNQKILETGTLQFESRTLFNGSFPENIRNGVRNEDFFHRHFSSRTGAVCQGGSRAARTTLAAVTFLAQTAGKQTKK